MFQFSKVANLILENTNRAYTREDFMNLLCDRAYQGTGGQKQPSLSNFNKWVNGAEERHGFKMLTEYYSDPRSIEELSEDIQVLLLDALTDLSGLMQRLYALLDEEVSGGYLSAAKREELTGGTEADQLAKMLQFVIVRKIPPNPVESPDFQTFFPDCSLPRRKNPFVGREEELAAISNQLREENILFITGVKGVGKTSLVLEYAKRAGKDYKNCIYLNGKNGFRSAMMALTPNGAMLRDGRLHSFEGRYQLLQQLKSDSLLILDGMELLPEEDDDFDLLLELNCHVLVTTPLQTDENSLYLRGMKEQAELLELFYAYCPKGKLEEGAEEHILKLIELVHQHTYSIQMLALTLNAGYMTALELRKKVVMQGLSFPNDVKIRTIQDGKRLRKTFYELLQLLFRIQNLDKRQQDMMMNFTLMPFAGISKRLFVEWSGTSAGVIEDLICLGWIQEDEDNQIYMEGIIREMVIENLRPTPEKCRRTVSSILTLFRKYRDHPVTYHDHEQLVLVSGCIEPMMLAFIGNTAECHLYEAVLSIYSYKMALADYKAMLEMFGSQMKELDFAAALTKILSIQCYGSRKGSAYLAHLKHRIKSVAYEEGICCGQLYEDTVTMIQHFVAECKTAIRKNQELTVEALMNRKSYMPQIEFTEREKLFLKMITIANQPKIVCYSD